METMRYHSSTNITHCGNIYKDALALSVEASVRLTFTEGNLEHNTNTLKAHIYFDLEILLLGIFTNRIIKDIHKDLGASTFSTGCWEW